MFNLFKKKEPWHFGTGLIESPVDTRDYLLSAYSHTPARIPKEFPPTFDLVIKNQGQTSHCVGYACSSLKDDNELRERNPVVFDGDWIYKECKKIDGIPTVRGTFFRAGMKVLKNVGAMPYRGGDPAKYKIGSYAIVDDNSFEGLKKAFVVNNTLLIGYRGDNAGWRTPYVKPPKQAEWGHAVCVPPETKILTQEGHKSIKDIKAGDVVLSHLGKWQVVTRTMKRHFRGLLNEIKTHNQVNPLFITDEHPVYIDKMVRGSKWKQKGKERQKHFEWVNASNVNSYNATLSPVPSLDSGKIDDADLAYLIGLYIADGNLKRGTLNPTKFKAIRFSLNREVDQKVQERLIKIFKEKFNLSPRFYYSKRGKDVQIIFYNANIARWFSKVGGTPNNKEINFDFLLSASKNDLESLIMGWLDGDGWSDGNGHFMGFTSSELLSYQVQIALQRCNMSYGIRKEKNRGWTIYVSLGKNMSKTHYWDKNEIKQIKKNRKEFYDGYVYNLEVENDNSYIAEGVAVHNCMVGYTEHHLIVHNSWGPRGDGAWYYVPKDYKPIEAWASLTDLPTGEIDEGKIGWVAEKYISNFKVVPTMGLRLRQGAGISYKIIETLPEGTQVEPLGERVWADGYWWIRIRV